MYRITHRFIYKRCSLFREILGTSGFDEDGSSSSGKSYTPILRKDRIKHLMADSDSSFRDRRRKRGRHRLFNPEKDVLKHRHETVVTPHVSTIAKNLFPRKLILAGEKEDSQDSVRVFESDCVVHMDNPDSMSWGEPFSGQSAYFKSVTVDGVQYCVRHLSSYLLPVRELNFMKVGDTVAVKPGENGDKVNAANAARSSAKSRNILANEAW